MNRRRGGGLGLGRGDDRCKLRERRVAGHGQSTNLPGDGSARCAGREQDARASSGVLKAVDDPRADPPDRQERREPRVNEKRHEQALSDKAETAEAFSPAIIAEQMHEEQEREGP